MKTASFQVALPGRIRTFVEGRAKAMGFRSSDHYVNALVEAEKTRLAKERLAQLLVEGVESGPATPMTKHDWEEIRREGKELVRGMKRDHERTCNKKAQSKARSA